MITGLLVALGLSATAGAAAYAIAYAMARPTAVASRRRK